MNKSELVEAISARTDVAKKDVAAVLDGMFVEVSKVVAKGQEKVSIPGFMTFEQVKRSARTGRNPQTGETIKVKASKAVKITPGSKLKAIAKGDVKPEK
jgi:DNA-binding protein HU-beta